MPDDADLHPFSSGLVNYSMMVAKRLNRVAGELLLVEAETALQDVAEAAARDGFNRASHALATINHFLEKLDLEADFRAEIESARNQLRERVIEMWPQFRMT